MTCLIPGAIGTWVRAAEPDPPFEPGLDPASPFRCTSCKRAFPTAARLAQHRRDRHPQEPK